MVVVAGDVVARAVVAGTVEAVVVLGLVAADGGEEVVEAAAVDAVVDPAPALATVGAAPPELLLEHPLAMKVATATAIAARVSVRCCAPMRVAT